jgi:hypothetical protein
LNCNGSRSSERIFGRELDASSVIEWSGVGSMVTASLVGFPPPPPPPPPILPSIREVTNEDTLVEGYLIEEHPYKRY